MGQHHTIFYVTLVAVTWKMERTWPTLWLKHLVTTSQSQMEAFSWRVVSIQCSKLLHPNMWCTKTNQRRNSKSRDVTTEKYMKGPIHSQVLSYNFNGCIPWFMVAFSFICPHCCIISFLFLCWLWWLCKAILLEDHHSITWICYVVPVAVRFSCDYDMVLFQGNVMKM